MPKYPKCNVMLIKYVQDKIMPLLQVTPNNDQQASWDERVERFEDGQEEKSAYNPSEQSNFYYLSRNEPVDLTFAVLVIRAMLLRARPTVVQSLSRQADIRLLEWMESLLDMFPVSEAELQGKHMGYSLSILLNQLYELRG